MWNKNSKSAPCQAPAKKLSVSRRPPGFYALGRAPFTRRHLHKSQVVVEKTGKADICGAQRGSMRRRVPFCLDSVEVGDLKFYELKMVLELGFLAPERINSFPCVRNCLTPFRPFRTPFARRRTKPSRSERPHTAEVKWVGV